MPSTPEDRRRKEYLAILQAGKEVPYEPKTEVNRRILAEVRAEVARGKQAIKDATDEGVRNWSRHGSGFEEHSVSLLFYPCHGRGGGAR